MTRPAGFSLSAMSRGTEGQGRKVIGKTLVAVSAAGMMAVLVALAQGRYLLALSAFLLTTGILEMMFQRALALFHGAPAARPAPGRAIAAPRRIIADR